MKTNRTDPRPALTGALRQLLATRGTSAVGDLGDYLLARLLAGDDGSPGRDAAAMRAAEIAGISGSQDALDAAYQALRRHHASGSRLADWGRDLAAAALADCGRAAGLYGGRQGEIMEEAADFAMRAVLPEVALRSAVTIRIASDPTGLSALTIHDALVASGGIPRGEIVDRVVYDVTAANPDLSNLAYAQLALTGVTAICRCRSGGYIVQPDFRTPAWRGFARRNGTGTPSSLTFVPAQPGPARESAR